MAAKAGALCITFIGRLDDVSTDGIQLIEDIRNIYDNYAFETEILAASVRHTMHIISCAHAGADVMTDLVCYRWFIEAPLDRYWFRKILSRL